jgi:hypothetical protein
MSVTPDYVEPVLAWRAWYAVDDVAASARLSSVFHSTLWPARAPLVAACERHRIPIFPFTRKRHDEAPHVGCTCGIHAATMNTVRTYLPDRFSASHVLPVLGRVALWGVVHEYERGWRASHAYPACLYVPIVEVGAERGERVIDGLSRYGVPVLAIDGATLDDVIEEITVLAA